MQSHGALPCSGRARRAHLHLWHFVVLWVLHLHHVLLLSWAFLSPIRSLMTWGLAFVQGAEGILRYGSPREEVQHAQVENPEKLVSFSSRMRPIKVMSTQTDANRLDLLAWAWIWAKRLPLLLDLEWHRQSEQICFCLYPYARTSAKCGVSTHRSPLNNSCPVDVQSKALQPGAGEI